jgi:polyphosphate glucokinase
MQILGIDVGGSGIKGAIVEIDNGCFVSDRHRIPTPTESTPANVAAAIRELVEEFDYSGTVGCCFPTVVIGGEIRTSSNLHDSWPRTQADKLFSEATGLPFVLVNDADAAGIAEMRLGAGKGLRGTVITITIGTGLGSGVFYDGRLIPNIELGHMPGQDGTPIEFYASDRARKRDGLSWAKWGKRFDYFLGRAARVMAPDHFILGGGASKKFDKYKHQITVETPISVAHFRNNAGIVGAALAAENSGVRESVSGTPAA